MQSSIFLKIENGTHMEQVNNSITLLSLMPKYETVQFTDSYFTGVILKRINVLY